MIYFLSKYILHALLFVFAKPKYYGVENLPEKGGVLICANHSSYMDPPVITCGIKRQIHYMAKSELFAVPVLGWILRSAGTFPVKRGVADRRALKHAIDLIQSGEVVSVFPEGTRNVTPKLLDANPGVSMIAMKSLGAVIPCAIINSDKLLPVDAKFFKFTKIYVVFGKPVDLNDLNEWEDTKAAYEECGKRIMNAIQVLLDEKRGQL